MVKIKGQAYHLAENFVVVREDLLDFPHTLQLEVAEASGPTVAVPRYLEVEEGGVLAEIATKVLCWVSQVV